jgi:hypothetical protein
MEIHPLTLGPLLMSFWVIVTVAITGGCSQAPSKPVEIAPPPYQFPPGVLLALDERIHAASVYARNEAEAYARVSMEEWQRWVRERTEKVFIPWYCAYGTQQWLSIKVAWYKLMYRQGGATPEDRLVSYLQQQFYEQVLKPVSILVGPEDVMENTAVYYLRELKGAIDPLPVEFQIPAAAFNKYLESIPAIVVRVAPFQRASLYAVLQTADLATLPAYKALRKEISTVNDVGSPTASPDKLKIVARRAVTRLVTSVEIRGGATAASTLVGGLWGVVISAASAAYGIMEYDQDEPAMEMQLRKNIGAAQELIWHELVEDQCSGVTSVMFRMSTQIGDAVQHRVPPAHSQDARNGCR